MELAHEYMHCIGATYSVKELVRIHELTPIHKLEDGKRIVEDICRSIIVRKNWQYISHATTLTNGNILVLIPTKSWSDGDGSPIYVFHFHALYKKDSGTGNWELVDVFCAKEFEPKWFKKERLRKENA